VFNLVLMFLINSDYFNVKAMHDNGLIGLVRPPHMHIAPPLNISEEELLDGFERMDKALYTLDEELGF